MANLIWPVPPNGPNGTYTFSAVQDYGDRVLNGSPSFHLGLDFGRASGTDIVAIANGSVVDKQSNNDVYGTSITLWHQPISTTNGQSFTSMYGHMLASSHSHLTTGAPTSTQTNSVFQGGFVGDVGATGKAIGAHLHLGIMVGGVRVDPQAFMRGILGGAPSTNPGGTTPPAAWGVTEAGSDNAWRALPLNFSASAVAAMQYAGKKYVYTIIAGRVYEAASSNNWTNLPMPMTGVSAVAASQYNGLKYVYTIANGSVYEAASSNNWTNLPMGISGASDVAAIVMNGVKYVYTVRNGAVWEAASNNNWTNLPMGISGASGVAAIAMNGVKYVYTLRSGEIFEAASNNGWINLSTGINGATDVAAMTTGGVKHVYTLVNGAGYEATSANRWSNLPMGIAGTTIAALAVPTGVKYVYTSQ